MLNPQNKLADKSLRTINCGRGVGRGKYFFVYFDQSLPSTCITLFWSERVFTLSLSQPSIGLVMQRPLWLPPPSSKAVSATTEAHKSPQDLSRGINKQTFAPKRTMILKTVTGQGGDVYSNLWREHGYNIQSFLADAWLRWRRRQECSSLILWFCWCF